MRSIKVSFEIPDAWELWYLDILDDDAPDEITPEWLDENPDKWEWIDMKDRGGDQRSNFMVEDQGLDT